MEPIESKVEVNEDAELDKELADTLASIRTENNIASAIPEQKTEVVPETPPDQPKQEPASPAPEIVPSATDPNQAVAEEFKAPKQGKFESDESFQKRVELASLVQNRKTAKTEEEKKRLSGEITSARRELSTLNHNDKITNPPNKEDAPVDPTANLDPEQKLALDNDKQRLKELGGVTQEEVAQILQNERAAIETKTTLENFVGRHPELKDEDAREVFFDFVDANFKWQGKSPKELMTVLELARESMFKPSESIQERILIGANVAAKVNAMQFPGGTIVKPGLTPEQQKSVDELKATGMSEDKALELISE